MSGYNITKCGGVHFEVHIQPSKPIFASLRGSAYVR